ncbi:uncharacterized protein [Dermacentor andersoni]|uniref:uncharacterized protein n=1 Tax=Dermacentor andersoni TaxID=34620 RepID=UPI0024179CB1|nr:mucin-17-like [Dermacentor andersoni]
MFKLKENMTRAQGVPDVKDMEDLITSEIVTSPLDVSLRVKLLRLLLHIGRVRDAYKNAFQIEEEPQFIAKAAYSIQWQSCMTDVMKAYHQNRAGPVDELFLTKYLLTLDQLTILMLHNPNSSTLFAVSGSKDIEPYKQGEQSLLDDAVSVIKSLDDLLKEAHKKQFLSGSWNFILQHFTAQLYLHMATLVLKNPVKVSCNWQVAHRWAAALLLNAYAAHPPSALSQEDWFLALDSEERNLYHNIFLRAHHRLSVSGHILHTLCNAEDKSSWLSDIKQEVCTPEVRNRIYRSIFDEKGKTSWFLQDTTFTNCTTEFPSPAALYKHDQESQWLHPSSLDHLAWLALQWSYLQDKKHAVIEQCFELQVFERLPLKPRSFTSGAAETLSQVDVQAFLEATCYCASQALGRKAFHLGQGPLALPPHVGMQLCTGSQADWWSAAYHMYASSFRSEVADVRRILQRGLEVIRAIGNHGMDLSLVVHLARIFANKSSHRHADGLEEEAEAFQDQAARYWEAVLTMLETYRITRSPVTPSGRLFCVPGGRGVTSLQELKNIKQEAKMFLAMCAMNSGCLDEAAEMFSGLMTAQAAYYTALVMEKMARKASRRGARYTLLLKERAALQLALERGCRQSDWTLASTVSAQLDDLQERLNLTSVTNGYHDDDNNDEPSRGGQGDSLHLSAHSNTSSVHWARQSSTPKPDKSFYPACTPPEKSPTSEATLESLSCQPRSAAAVEAPAIANRFLELQLHTISLHQELTVSRLLGMEEASQSMIKEQLDNHRAVLAEVKQQKAAMEQLTKKIDEVAATTAVAADAALCSQRQNEGSEHRDEQVSGRGLEHNYSRYETAASSRATPRMARSRRRTALPLSVPHVQGPAYGSYSMPHFGHSFASQHLGQPLACHFAWQLFLSPQGTIALSTVPTPFPDVAGQFANDNSRPPPSTVSASSTPSRVVNADELPMPTTTTNALPIWGGAGGSPQTAPPSFPTSTFITPSTMAAYCQAVSAPQPGAVETTAPLASTPNDQAPFTAFGTETERGNQRLSPFSLKSFDINRLPPSTLSTSSAPFHLANGDVVEASNFSHHAEPQLPAVVAAIPTKSLHPPHFQAICQQTTTDSKGADDSNSSPGSILTTYAANSKATTFPDSMSCFSAPGTVSAPSLFGSKASTTATPAQLFGSQMAVSSASVTGGTALPIPTSSLSTSKMVLASSVSGSITYGKATSTQPLDLPLSMCSTETAVAPLFSVPNLCFSTPEATPAASMFGAATATRMTPALSSGLPVTTSTVAAIYTVATTSTTFSVSAIGTSAAMLAPSMFEPTTGTTVAPAASTTAITIPTKFSALTPSVLSFDSQGTTPAVSGSFYTGMSRLHATTFDNFSRSPESSTCTCNVNNAANKLACQVHGLKKQDIVGHKTAEFSQPAIELNAVASTPDGNAPTKLFDTKGLVFPLGASALSHNLSSFGGVFGGSRASGNEEFGHFQFGSTPKATEYRTNVVDSAAIATTAKEPSHSVLEGNVTLSGRKEPMSAASALGSTATSANNVSKGFEVTSSLKVGAFSKERMPAVAESATSVPSRPQPAASTSYSSLAQKSSSTVFSEPVSTASSIVIGLPRGKVSIGTETVTCEPPLTLHVNQQLLPNGPSLVAGSSSLPLGGENDKKKEHRPFNAQPIAAGNLTNSTPSPDKKEPTLARPVLSSTASSSGTACSEPASTASSIVVELPRGKASIGTETATFETPVPSLVAGSSSLPLGGENKEKAEHKPFNAQPVPAGNLTNSTPSPDKKEPTLARPVLSSTASSSGTVSNEPVSTASSIVVELPRGKVSTGTQTATQTVSGTVSSEPVSTASSILVELPRGKVSTGTQTATCEPPVPSLVAGSSSLLLAGENDKEKEEQNPFNVQPVAAGSLTNSTPSPDKKEPTLARPVLSSTASSSGTACSEPASTASSIVVELPRGKVSIGTETATFETPVPSLVAGSSSLPLGGENKEKAEHKPFNAQPVPAGNLTNSTPSPDKKEPKLARPVLSSTASSSGTVSSEPVSTASSIVVELPRGKVSTGTQTATQTVSGTVSSEPVSTASSILVELPRGKVSTGTQTATCEPPVPSLVAGSSSLLLGGENDKEKEEQNPFNIQPVAAGNLTNSTPSPDKKEPILARPVLSSTASSSGTVSSEPVSTASSIVVELPRGKVSTGTQTATCEPPVPSLVAGSSSLLLGGEIDKEKEGQNPFNVQPVAAGNLTNSTPSPDKKEPTLARPVLGSADSSSRTVCSEPVSTASSIVVELPRGKVSIGTETATFETPVPSLVAGSSSLPLGGENKEKAEHKPFNAQPVPAGNLTNSTPSPDKKEPKLARPVLSSTASSSGTVSSEPVSTASSIVVELPRGKVSTGTQTATQTVSGTVSSEPVSTASSILVELPRGKVSTGTQTATCEPPVPSLVAGSSSLLLGGENDKEKEEQNPFNIQPVAAGNLTNSTPSPDKKEPILARPVLSSTASSSGTVSSEPVSTASSIVVELPRGKVSTGTQTATCEPPVPSLVAGSSSLLLGGEIDKEKEGQNPFNVQPVAAGNLTNSTPSPDKKEPTLARPVLGSADSSSRTVCSEPVSTASSPVVELPRGKVSIGTETAKCEPPVPSLVAGSSSVLLGGENDEEKQGHNASNTRPIAAGHLKSSATSPDKKEPKSTRPVLGSMASSSGTVCSVPVSISSSIVVELSRGKMSIDVETATGGPPTPSLVAGSSSLPLGAESKEKAEHKPFDVQPVSTGNFTNSTPSPDKKEPKLARPVLGSAATSSRTVCSEPVSTASSIVVELPRGKVSIGTEIATCEPRVSCLVAGSSSLPLGEENDEEKEEHRPVNTQPIAAGHLNSSTSSPDKKEPKSTRPVLGSTASSSNTVCSEPVSPASSIVVELSRRKASIDVETATCRPPTPSLVAGSSSLPLGAESKEKAEHKPFDVQPVSTGNFTNSTPSPDKKEPKLARPVLGSAATSSRTVCSEPVSTASSIVVELPRGKVSIGTEIATCEPRVSCLVAGSSSLLLGEENDEEKEEHRPVNTQPIAAGHLNSSTSSPDKKEPKSTRPVLGSTASSSNTVCSEPVSPASSIVVELSRGKASIDVETATCRPPTPSLVAGSSSLPIGAESKEKAEHKPFDVQPVPTGNFTNSTPSPDKKEPKLARPVLGSAATSSRTVCSEPVSTASSIVVELPRGKVSIGTEIATCEPRVSCLVAGSSSLLLGEENDEEKEEHRPVNTQPIAAGHLNSSTSSPDKKEPKSTRPVLDSTASSSNTVCSEPVSPASSIVVELSRGKASIGVETATCRPPTPSPVTGSSSLLLGGKNDKEKEEPIANRGPALSSSSNYDNASKLSSAHTEPEEPMFLFGVTLPNRKQLDSVTTAHVGTTFGEDAFTCSICVDQNVKEVSCQLTEFGGFLSVGPQNVEQISEDPEQVSSFVTVDTVMELPTSSSSVESLFKSTTIAKREESTELPSAANVNVSLSSPLGGTMSTTQIASTSHAFEFGVTLPDQRASVSLSSSYPDTTSMSEKNVFSLKNTTIVSGHKATPIDVAGADVELANSSSCVRLLSNGSTITMKDESTVQSHLLMTATGDAETIKLSSTPNKLELQVAFPLPLEPQVTSPQAKPSASTLGTIRQQADSLQSTGEASEEFESSALFEPMVSLPELMEITTGEEDEDVLFCERAKLSQFDAGTKQWKEHGIGLLESEDKPCDKNLAAQFRTQEQADVFKQTFESCKDKAQSTKTLKEDAGEGKSGATQQQADMKRPQELAATMQESLNSYACDELAPDEEMHAPYEILTYGKLANQIASLRGYIAENINVPASSGMSSPLSTACSGISPGMSTSGIFSASSTPQFVNLSPEAGKLASRVVSSTIKPLKPMLDTRPLHTLASPSSFAFEMTICKSSSKPATSTPVATASTVASGLQLSATQSESGCTSSRDGSTESSPRQAGMDSCHIGTSRRGVRRSLFGTATTAKKSSKHGGKHPRRTLF